MLLFWFCMLEATPGGCGHGCGHGRGQGHGLQCMQFSHFITSIPPWPHAAEEDGAGSEHENNSKDDHADDEGSLTVEWCFRGSSGGGDCG